MRLLASAAVAVVVLWLVDKTFNHGHYTDVVLAVARGLARTLRIG